MRFIRGLSDAIALIEKAIITALLAAMVLLAFLQVFLRNVFATGLLWADPFLRHAVLWVGFFGASLATQQEKHINIDLFTRFLPPRSTNIIRIATNLFAGVVCWFLARAGWTFLQSEMISEGSLFSIGGLEFQTWWVQTVIPLGFGLMSFRFILRSVEHLIDAFRREAHVSQTMNVPSPGA